MAEWAVVLMARIDEEKEHDVKALAVAMLAENAGFQLLTEMLRAQAEVRRKAMHGLISTPEQMAEHNRLLGEIDGIHLAINYPKMIKSKLETDDALKQFDKENTNGR